MVMVMSASATNDTTDDNDANVSTFIPMEKNVVMDSKVNQSSNTNTINNDTINHSNYTKLFPLYTLFFLIIVMDILFLLFPFQVWDVYF